jgi:hypothetical protein
MRPTAAKTPEQNSKAGGVLDRKQFIASGVVVKNEIINIDSD